MGPCEGRQGMHAGCGLVSGRDLEGSELPPHLRVGSGWGVGHAQEVVQQPNPLSLLPFSLTCKKALSSLASPGFPLSALHRDTGTTGFYHGLNISPKAMRKAFRVVIFPRRPEKGFSALHPWSQGTCPGHQAAVSADQLLLKSGNKEQTQPLKNC